MGSFTVVRTLLVTTALAAGCLGAAPASAPPARPAQPVVMTEYGPVAGFHRDGVMQFRGIRYAAPPVGALRWRPPQPPARWAATVDAVNFGDTCPQNQAGRFAKPSITEDCLYLNVYTPATFASHPEHRPVFVWFYGGAMTAGESNDYNGSKLARQGDTVVVTVNFRVGYLGFLAQQALDAEGHDFGNYGIMDMQFALKWVQANIARFGGDPHRVTIFGQSGGATAEMSNLVSPLSAGLFQRAINESGTHITATPLADAETRGQTLVTKAGCASATDVPACMRKLTTLQILDLGLPPPSYFVQDGKIITGDPLEQFRTGHFNHVPIMTGLVEDEQAFFLPEINELESTPLSAKEEDAYVNSYGAQYADAIRAAYPIAAYKSPSLAEIAVAQGNKACIARTFDRWWSQYVPVYAYQFDEESTPSYLPPVSYPTLAYHTSELLYIFPLFRGGQGQAHVLTPAQEHLSDQMVAYWTSFARSGNPNNAMDPVWQPYSAAKDDVNALVDPKPHMTYGYGAQSYHDDMKNDCTLWDPIPLTGARS